MFGNPLHAFFVGLYPGTPAERNLEPHIAALGFPYRTQFPYFIWGLKIFPDVLFPTLGLILEVDDPSHEEPEKRKKDADKTSSLEALGWRVLRCTNKEALTTPTLVIDRIRAFLAAEGARDLSQLFPPKPTRPSRRKPRPRASRRSRLPPSP